MQLYQPLLTLNWNLLFSAITVIVLFIILKVFFFEKVHDFMVRREQDVKGQLENAEQTNKLADEKLRSYEAKIANLESDGRKIIKAARDEAKNQAKDIVDEANNTARQMIEHSQKEIRREQYNARKKLTDEVGSLALMAAEQIMEKELTPDDHEEIVDKIIREAEDKPWN